jgi:hypothetical protein
MRQITGIDRPTRRSPTVLAVAYNIGVLGDGGGFTMPRIFGVKNRVRF